MNKEMLLSLHLSSLLKKKFIPDNIEFDLIEFF